ncbi:MAG: MFS transporter [Agrobacterium cavarae]|uniref:MFS transporter n=1 Tax=Agrobacterium cavarae TaxID=2528239 RepID=UPI0031A744B0
MTAPRTSHCHYLLCVTASAVGRNIYLIVVAWLMMKYTADPSAIAMLLAAGSCAEFLTTNLGGVVTDRYRPQLTCLVCDGFRILTMAAATVGMMLGYPVQTLVTSWVLYSVLDRTYLTALQAMIPGMVDAARLLSFNSTAYVWMQIGNFCAAVAAGLVLTFTPDYLSLMAPLACFSLSFGSSFARRELHCGGYGKAEPVTFLRRELFPGLPQQSLVLPSVVYAFIYAAGMMVSVLGSALVMGEFGGSALAFGFVEAGWAAGSVLGCLWLLFRSAKSNALLWHLLVTGIILANFLVFQNLFVALLQMMGLGVTYNIARILIDVEIQRSFPISQLGRARSQVHTVCMALSLFVYGVVALIGNALAPSVIFGWFGVVALFTGTLFWACFRRDLLAAR